MINIKYLSIRKLQVHKIHKYVKTGNNKNSLDGKIIKIYMHIFQNLKSAH